ncbi:MAG: 50S ribosomal protein L3 [Candidatus Eisenbacteria bacterium]|uniref:Large ribosomal subunit protein uL3 n=1 Tax=Eiseniibacteriota bacterium TaxID=2212470 RepID=A0A948W643_UNCEI|nr:50S ribosomal protein L3 [Candidatus Eisenbacteria bacterium]MBU2691119.1 50S ribosomal protein L3 [Candidatus Eisenbacteria bacterium]
MNTLIGKKIGMTQIYSETGELNPVTVLEVGPCRVAQVRTPKVDGYSAVQLGYGEIKDKQMNKPRRGHFDKWGVPPSRHLMEVRCEPEAHKPGDTLSVEMFKVGELVHIIARSKGRGFQGVVKRHGFHGGPETHGCKTHDSPGSIGASAYPSHVMKGKKLPGQMGNARITIKNLKVVGVDTERNLLMVKGSVPGARNGIIMVRSTGRMAKR